MQEGDNLHVQHTKKQDWKTSKPVLCSLMWKAHLQAPSYLFFQTENKHPKYRAVVSVSSWLSEYWIIYPNGLVSDSNTSFTPPSSQWVAVNSPYATKLPT